MISHLANLPQDLERSMVVTMLICLSHHGQNGGVPDCTEEKEKRLRKMMVSCLRILQEVAFRNIIVSGPLKSIQKP